MKKIKVISKCKGCGITLDGKEEREDNRCANCQADYIRTKAKSTFQATIDMLNYLEEDDFEQDTKLQDLYEDLASYFTR